MLTRRVTGHQAFKASRRYDNLLSTYELAVEFINQYILFRQTPSMGASSEEEHVEKKPFPKRLPPINNQGRVVPEALGLSLTAELHRYDTLTASEHHISGMESTRLTAIAQAGYIGAANSQLNQEHARNVQVSVVFNDLSCMS